MLTLQSSAAAAAANSSSAVKGMPGEITLMGLCFLKTVSEFRRDQGAVNLLHLQQIVVTGPRSSSLELFHYTAQFSHTEWTKKVSCCIAGCNLVNYAPNLKKFHCYKAYKFPERCILLVNC